MDLITACLASPALLIAMLKCVSDMTLGGPELQISVAQDGKKKKAPSDILILMLPEMQFETRFVRITLYKQMKTMF